MKYEVRINKRIKYIRIYGIIKRVGSQENALTRLFSKAFAKKKEY